MNNTSKANTVKVRYNGAAKKFVAGMKYLQAGPYDFSSGTCDVHKDDSDRMILQCPGSFSLVEMFSCDECGKEYMRKGDLNNHIANAHKNEADDDI